MLCSTDAVAFAADCAANALAADSGSGELATGEVDEDGEAPASVNLEVRWVRIRLT